MFDQFHKYDLNSFSEDFNKKSGKEDFFETECLKFCHIQILSSQEDIIRMSKQQKHTLISPDWKTHRHREYLNMISCVPCIILQYVNNQRHALFLIIKFIPKFLSALHVSNETSHSSSGAQLS